MTAVPLCPALTTPSSSFAEVSVGLWITTESYYLSHHMSSNIVWKEGVESLNEDLLLVKISERTPPPPSIPTFGFLHLCFQTWGGGKQYRVMSHHEGGGEFVSRSPLPPLRHPELLKPPALLVSMSDLALSLCVSHLFLALSVSLYRT